MSRGSRQQGCRFCACFLLRGQGRGGWEWKWRLGHSLVVMPMEPWLRGGLRMSKPMHKAPGEVVPKSHMLGPMGPAAAKLMF